MKYFYVKAKERNPNVSEEEFRYPGPIPQTKEAAVVSIADSCEAAVRAMDSARALALGCGIDRTWISDLRHLQRLLLGCRLVHQPAVKNHPQEKTCKEHECRIPYNSNSLKARSTYYCT